MIVLDTNVVSETTKQRPDPEVVHWFEASGDELYLTAVTAGELLFGVARLTDGQRRKSLTDAISELLRTFRDRILPYDTAAAGHYGTIAAHCESIGRPISAADAQIAAICLAHKAVCATRNVKDFEETGVELMNPWRDGELL